MQDEFFMQGDGYSHSPEPSVFAAIDVAGAVLNPTCIDVVVLLGAVGVVVFVDPTLVIPDVVVEPVIPPVFLMQILSVEIIGVLKCLEILPTSLL
jgi:hypothetical protein